jgi:DNA-binding transcriptional LysR family regulator
MRHDHPLANAPLTEEGFLGADHLLVSLSGSPVGVADAVLDRIGQRRRVAMTLNNFGGVPSLLLASDLISVLPEGVIRTHALRDEIYSCDAPLDIPQFDCLIAWHARNDREPGHRWIRALVIQTCSRIWRTELGE